MTDSPDQAEAPKTLAEILLDKNLLSPAQIELAIADQDINDIPLEEILLVRGWITQEKLFEVAPWLRPGSKLPAPPLSKSGSFAKPGSGKTGSFVKPDLSKLAAMKPNAEQAASPASFAAKDGVVTGGSSSPPAIASATTKDSDKAAATRSDKPQATVDKSQATVDKSQATADKSQAAADKSQATTDKSQATADKSQATTDKSQATTDKSQATADKSQATADKSQATADKSQATADKSQATTNNNSSEKNAQSTNGADKTAGIPPPPVSTAGGDDLNKSQDIPLVAGTVSGGASKGAPRPGDTKEPPLNAHANPEVHVSPVKGDSEQNLKTYKEVLKKILALDKD